MPGLNVVINLTKLALFPTPSIDKAFQHLQSVLAIRTIGIRTIGELRNRSSSSHAFHMTSPYNFET